MEAHDATMPQKEVRGCGIIDDVEAESRVATHRTGHPHARAIEIQPPF